MCVVRGVCSLIHSWESAHAKGLTSVTCGFSTVLVVSALSPGVVQGSIVLQNPILLGPGKPRKVQFRSEGTDLDFTKVTEGPKSSHRGHCVQRNILKKWA